jgi:hypothetical protein
MQERVLEIEQNALIDGLVLNKFLGGDYSVS